MAEELRGNRTASRSVVGFDRLRASVFGFAALFVVALVLIQAVAYWARYEAALRGAGLAPVLLEPASTRREKGVAVPGLVAVASKA